MMPIILSVCPKLKDIDAHEQNFKKPMMNRPEAFNRALEKAIHILRENPGKGKSPGA
ncbi:MAG: hypothetical protein KKF30_12355 [Proteobacteria bacterium]|nr:hypothetical protein [Pseudomonadota bacterium]MBU4469472.1 hypothetical protein [Pseudomonadota bacterium]MCG2752373.1 hypothetical protein [Desulfobacteraceae bacterium]